VLKKRWNIVVVVAVMLAAVSRSSKARADEERPDEERSDQGQSDDGRTAKRRWLNPFASEAQPEPGRLSAAIHGGSVHTQGLGLDLGVTAFPWLEGKLSYGRNSGHSAVAYLKGTLIPTASLSPYLIAGYGYGVSNLKGGISFHTHQVVTGLGLQARFAERFYVGGELTINIVLLHILTEKTQSFPVEVTDPWTVAPGFVAGVWFL
jgi:hypothetical protein